MMTICISFMSVRVSESLALTELFVLFHGALVDDLYECLVDDLGEDAPAGLLALEEDLPRVVRAHDYHPEVRRVVVDVHVQKEVLRDTRQADGCPGLSVLHRGVRVDVGQQHVYVYIIRLE